MTEDIASTDSPESEKRLEDVLNSEDEAAESSAAEPADAGRKASPLTTLKSIVLSMEWEINDVILTEFVQELIRLKTVFHEDVIVVKCLQLLEAIGKYILQKKAQTHPDSIRLLQFIYRDMEILLLSKGISESAKRSILADEIAQFKKLKEKLAGPAKSSSGDYAVKTIKTYTAAMPTGSGLPLPRAAADQETLPPHEAFHVAVEEMKKMIQAEFGAIRAELKLWRKGW
jgi:hypothetical protein